MAYITPFQAQLARPTQPMGQMLPVHHIAAQQPYATVPTPQHQNYMQQTPQQMGQQPPQGPGGMPSAGAKFGGGMPQMPSMGQIHNPLEYLGPIPGMPQPTPQYPPAPQPIYSGTNPDLNNIHAVANPIFMGTIPGAAR